MNQELLHHYRRFRQHQAENDGGGAWPGEHAIAAYLSAKRHIHFVKWLAHEVKKGKRKAKRK